MRILPIACVLAGLVGADAARAGSRNPFVPRTWPRTSPASSIAKTGTCGYGTTAFLTPLRAEAVARVEIVAMRGSSLDVKVVDQLKGTTGTSLVAYSAGTCRDRLKAGETVIVMTRGNSLVYGENVLAASDPRAPVLAALLRAKSDRARAKLASDAAGSTDDTLSDEAARYLLATPSVLNELGMRHKRTLFLAAKRRPTRDLALVLARLRLRIPLVIYDDLGLRDSVARHIAGILDFEAERDPDALADAIQREPDPIRQLAAFERCDRLRKTTTTMDPARWLADTVTRKTWTPVQLEAWCRGQTPPTTRPPYVRHYPPPPPPPVKLPRKTSGIDDRRATPRAASGDLLPLKPWPCDPFATAHGCKRH